MVKRILLVEDDQFVRELYSELLKNEGYEVVEAADGEDGFNKAQKGGFDLILLDLILPKIDGLLILEKLEEEPPVAPNGKIVLLTNLGQENIPEKAQKLGLAGFLIKSSLTPDQFLNEVKKYLPAQTGLL